MKDIDIPASGIPPLWWQFQNKCVHFNGLQKVDGKGPHGFPNWVRREECEAGVKFADVTIEREQGSKLPCLVRLGDREIDRPDSCPHFRTLTDEEAQAKEAELRDRHRIINEKIDAGICPNHNRPMTLRQVGRCVYADPCGCRLYQGKVPA